MGIFVILRLGLRRVYAPRDAFKRGDGCMRVLLGNTSPRTVDQDGRDGRARVTTIDVPGDYSYEVADVGSEHEVGADDVQVIESAADLANAVLRQVATGGGVTHLPGQESVLAVLAAWAQESNGAPAWVASDDPEFEVLLGHVFGCRTGLPEDVEATHHTNSGPPGVGPVEAAALAEWSAS